MQYILGGAVVLATLAALVLGLVARTRPARRAPGRFRMTPAGRRVAMLVLSIGSALAALPALVPPLRRGAFALCASCPVLPGMPAAVAQLAGTAAAEATLVGRLLLSAWYYAATILPVFILACLLSGLILARSDRFRVSGFWRSFGFGALLPVCSCGVVPLGKAMLERGGTGRRDGLVFLATAPLLSPVILVLAFVAMGPVYTALRVAASVVVAFAVARVVMPFLPEESHSDGEGEVRVPAAGRSSVLETGLGTLAGLFRYALYGIAVGAAFTAILPTGLLAAVIRPGTLSMAAAVLVGVPVSMCGGEEVLLTAPLVSMGLGLGHAVAFALASTGICAGSIPLLAAVLGRRGAVAMIATYLLVPFIIGLLINVLL